MCNCSIKHSPWWQSEHSCNNFYNRLCELNVLKPQPAENPQFLSVERNKNCLLFSVKKHNGSLYAGNLLFSYWNSRACNIKWQAIGSGLNCHSWYIFSPCWLLCPRGLPLPTETSTQAYSQTIALHFKVNDVQFWLTLVFQAKDYSPSGADLWLIELSDTWRSRTKGHNCFIPCNLMHCQVHVSPES